MKLFISSMAGMSDYGQLALFGERGNNGIFIVQTTKLLVGLGIAEISIRLYIN